jgi:outer membrane phospholipase A
MAATAPPRSINTYFIEPTFNFGDYHFSRPQGYAYLGPTRDNPDIGDYRGHMDLKLAYGKPDGVEVATMLRKASWAASTAPRPVTTARACCRARPAT